MYLLTLSLFSMSVTDSYFVLILFIYLFLAALGLHCGARASHCSGFSCCGARALGARAAIAVARGLSSCSTRA